MIEFKVTCCGCGGDGDCATESSNLGRRRLLEIGGGCF